MILLADGIGQFAVEPLEFVDLFVGDAFGDGRGEFAGDRRLQPEDVFDIGAAERHHDMPAVRFELHHAFAAQRPQRFAHRVMLTPSVAAVSSSRMKVPGRSTPVMISALRCAATSSDNCSRRTRGGAALLVGRVRSRVSGRRSVRLGAGLSLSCRGHSVTGATSSLIKCKTTRNPTSGVVNR